MNTIKDPNETNKTCLHDSNGIRTHNHLVRKLCCHFNFRYVACFEEGVPSHSRVYREQIHSASRTWDDNNIQSCLHVLGNFYEIPFPKIKIKVNSKTRLIPWITRGILIASKRRQKLYEIFLNSRNSINKNYKNFIRLFKPIKEQLP